MHLRLAIDVAKQASRLRVRDGPLRLHPHAAHERHVEHQRAVGRGQARDVVAAALDAEQQVVGSRELHARDHVADAEAPHHRGGPSVDHGVPDGPGLVVAGVGWHEQGSPQARLQTVECFLLEVDLPAVKCSHSHVLASPDVYSRIATARILL